MRNLSIAIVAVLSLVSFAGCKKKGADEAINKMTEFKDKMCACKDKACADKVSEEMNKWGQEQKGGDKEAKVTEDDAKKMAAVTEEFSKCMTKLMMPDTTGAAPATPPAGDKPADPAAAPAGTAPAAPAAGDKPADPAAAPAAPAAGDKKPDEKK